MDRTKYEEIFSQESGRYLQDLDDLLLRVENDSRNRELWGEIHGKLHSIKGMARALSLDKITNLGHAMETWCKAFQSGDLTADDRVIQSIYDGADCLRQLVARKGDIETFEDQRWYSDLLTNFEKNPHRGADGGPAAAAPVSSAPKETPVAAIKEVRVRYSLIEELLGLSQEVQLLEKNLPPLPQSQAFTGLKGWLDHCSSLMKVMYFRLMHLRLMAVGDFAGLFKKTIRNLAASHGKKVTFDVAGQDIEADITILERLREPLVHILRNSIAHGIETPAERHAAGKPEQGRIFIKAASEKDSLHLAVGDDGRGIDRAAIAAYLQKHLSLSADEIEDLDDEALYNTILRPDFSSRSQADDLAGRGIGMSVVAQAINYLGGTIRISSTPGKGTTFHIRLPLSMAIVQAITFTVAGYTLSIPTHQVATIDRVANLDAEAYARVVHLGDLLGLGDQSKDLHTIGLKRGPDMDRDGSTGEKDLLLGVETIVGNRPLMVLPVGELLASAAAFSGAGIMENGDVTMMLDTKFLRAP